MLNLFKSLLFQFAWAFSSRTNFALSAFIIFKSLLHFKTLYDKLHYYLLQPMNRCKLLDNSVKCSFDAEFISMIILNIVVRLLLRLLEQFDFHVYYQPRCQELCWSHFSKNRECCIRIFFRKLIFIKRFRVANMRLQFMSNKGRRKATCSVTQ